MTETSPMTLACPPRRAALRGLAALMLAPTPLLGLAADARYPDKPLRILVGASPGGGTDILARLLADKFSPALGQPVVVENRPGASNTIAADLAAHAPADGSTLLLATNTGQAVAPHLLKLKYDPLKDLQPIGLVAVMPNVLIVPADAPYRSVQDLLAAMRAKPGGFRYASSGIGSTQHVAGEAFTFATGTKAIHVPYRGSSQAHLDIIGGQVEMMFDSTSSAMGQIRAGKFRALAVAAPRRIAELPDVPTLAQSGVNGADVDTWYGLYVTGGTPRAAVEQLAATLTQSLGMPDVQDRIKGLGGEIKVMGIGPFADMNRSEFERYGKLVRDTGMRAE